MSTQHYNLFDPEANRLCATKKKEGFFDSDPDLAFSPVYAPWEVLIYKEEREKKRLLGGHSVGFLLARFILELLRKGQDLDLVLQRRRRALFLPFPPFLTELEFLARRLIALEKISLDLLGEHASLLDLTNFAPPKTAEEERAEQIFAACIQEPMRLFLKRLLAIDLGIDADSGEDELADWPRLHSALMKLAPAELADKRPDFQRKMTTLHFLGNCVRLSKLLHAPKKYVGPSGYTSTRDTRESAEELVRTMYSLALGKELQPGWAEESASGQVEASEVSIASCRDALKLIDAFLETIEVSPPAGGEPPAPSSGGGGEGGEGDEREEEREEEGIIEAGEESKPAASVVADFDKGQPLQALLGNRAFFKTTFQASIQEIENTINTLEAELASERERSDCYQWTQQKIELLSVLRQVYSGDYSGLTPEQSGENASLEAEVMKDERYGGTATEALSQSESVGVSTGSLAQKIACEVILKRAKHIEGLATSVTLLAKDRKTWAIVRRVRELARIVVSLLFGRSSQLYTQPGRGPSIFYCPTRTERKVCKARVLAEGVVSQSRPL